MRACRTLWIAVLQIASASALANASSHAVANLYTNTTMNMYTNTSMNDGDGPDKGGLQYPDPGQGYPPTVPDGKLPGQEQQQGGESRTRLHALRARALARAFSSVCRREAAAALWAAHVRQSSVARESRKRTRAPMLSRTRLAYAWSVPMASSACRVVER